MKGENEMKKWKKPELLIIDEKEIETHIETYARSGCTPGWCGLPQNCAFAKV